MELGIDFGVPTVMLVLGACLVWWVGLGKWRWKAARRCLKCGYDMRGSEGLTCVECGYAARSLREVEHGRLRRGWMALGLVLCLPMIWLAGFWAWYTPEALARRRVDAQGFNDNAWTVGDVTMRLDFVGDGSTSKGVRERRIAILDWVMGNTTDKTLAGRSGERYCSPEGLTPSLDPFCALFDRPISWGRRYLFYTAHLCLYPMSHYSSYLPCRAVDTVNINGMGKQPLPEAMLESLKVFDEVTYLSVYRVAADGRMMDAVNGMAGLERLLLFDGAMETEKLAGLKRLRDLREVILEFDRPVTVGDIKALSDVKGLEWIRLGARQKVEGDVESALAQLVEAHRLKGVFLSPYRMTGQGRERLAHAVAECRTLQALEIDVEGWKPEEVRALGGLALVKSLSLRRNGWSQSNGRDALKGVVGLGVEDLTLLGFHGVDLSFLEQLKGARTLKLGAMTVDVATVKAISGMDVLRRLSLEEVDLTKETLLGFTVPKTMFHLEITPWVPDEEECAWMVRMQMLSNIAMYDISEKNLEMILKAERKPYRISEVTLRKSTLSPVAVGRLRQHYQGTAIHALSNHE